MADEFVMPYCDKNGVRDMILDLWEPWPEGLYLHEVQLIASAKLGFLTTSIWDMWGAYYPKLFIDNMVERGYIRLIKPEEVPKLLTLNYEKLKNLLKCSGVKIKGNRAALEELARKYVTGEHVKQWIKSSGEDFSFYAPTEKGSYILTFVGPLTHIWEFNNIGSLSHPIPNIRKPTKEELDKQIEAIDAAHHCITFRLNLDLPNQYRWKLVSTTGLEAQGLGYPALDFEKEPIDLTIVKDGNEVEYKHISWVFPERESNKIILWQVTDADDEVLHITLDTRPGRPLTKGAGVLGSKSREATAEEREFYHRVDKNTYSQHEKNGKLCYYFSIPNEVSRLFVENELTSLGELSKLQNLFDDADDCNYMLEVKDWNDSGYMGHLLLKHIINMPRLYGADLDKLFDFAGLEFSDMNPTSETELLQREIAYGVYDALNKLSERFGNGNEAWISLLTHYPKEILVLRNFNPFLNGLFEQGYGWSDDYKRYDQRIKDGFLHLKETGLIAPRWISEFGLYLEVKNLYEDTVYQYRDSWLGNQSLDIYIPSKKLGIEYQGEQHYRPISVFGDETDFAHRQELDAKKRELCVTNGVKLLEWPFDLEITPGEVKKQIECALKE